MGMLKDLFKKPAQAPAVKASDLLIVRDFHSKVVGVTYGNDNGTSRQAILKNNCKPGDDIIFKPTPSPQYPDSVGVFTTTGLQMGYLSAELAYELKTKYPCNPMAASISNVTGGGEDYNYGCNIHIIIYAIPAWKAP